MLPFILYAGAGKRELTDDNKRGEHGSIDEAVAALEWIKRLEKALAWAVVVRAEDDAEAWTWGTEKKSGKTSDSDKMMVTRAKPSDD